ncbi:MAG: pyruvate kinase, partial [Acetobacteraceae bacterium]|nr:pyruvate kinase [Acetobacteraceae bacterium]
SRPSRAEVTDVANAIFDGTDAVMLSEETAVGRYFAEAAEVMARIASRTEEALPYEELLYARARWASGTVADAISYATCAIADRLKAQAIITPTQSGHTARMVARYRPRAPIVAVTPDLAVARRLALVWGVRPLVAPLGPDTDSTLRMALEAAAQAGEVRPGDLSVLTAGVPVGVAGTTNMLKVQRVGGPAPEARQERSPPFS